MKKFFFFAFLVIISTNVSAKVKASRDRVWLSNQDKKRLKKLSIRILNALAKRDYKRFYRLFLPFKSYKKLLPKSKYKTEKTYRRKIFKNYWKRYTKFRILRTHLRLIRLSLSRNRPRKLKLPALHKETVLVIKEPSIIFFNRGEIRTIVIGNFVKTGDEWHIFIR